MSENSGAQMPLDLSLRPAFGREDFLVTPSNAAAVALVDQWPNWPSYAAIIVGPPGSGKTHLAEVFRQRSQALKMAAAALKTDLVPALMERQAAVIEDAGPSIADERAFFHVLNLARQERKHVLVTAGAAPSAWQINLPDLASRLRALPVVNILLPDDDLLRGVIVKHFVDRQINVQESVVTYLAQRIPRSLDAVRAIIAEIDRAAMAEKAEISRPFAAKVLARFTNPSLFGQGD